MSNPNAKALAALDDLAITTSILIDALVAADLAKAHEAVSILLMQGMTHFGPASPVMQQFFPVWDAIKQHIDRRDVQRALGQARQWSVQLQEVISMGKGS